MTTVNTRIGQITVNSDGGDLTPVELNTSAWRYLEATLFELTRGLTYSHSNIERPGDYDLVVPPFPQSVRRTLRMVTFGAVDHEGERHDDRMVGIESNLNYIETHITAIPDLADRPDGTREVTVDMPSGEKWRNDLTFLGAPVIGSGTEVALKFTLEVSMARPWVAVVDEEED